MLTVGACRDRERSLDFLFDTGASTKPSNAALSTIHDGGPSSCATSFVYDTIMARWHSRRADWTYVPAAEYRTSRAMIRVPRVSIAGYTVGPVWFTARSVADFDGTVNLDVDRPGVGALGGSLLRYFKVTVDYPHQLAQCEQL